MDWTIQDLGAIGEFIGAIGVVITLVYLAYQIRQNTSQLKQSTLTATAAAISASNLALRETRHSLYESAEMAEIFLRGNSSPEALDEVEMMRYRLCMQNVTDVMVDIYTQTLITSFSPETWAAQGVNLVKRILSTPGGQWFWTSYAHTYPSSFCAEVERILHNTTVEPAQH